MTSKVKLNNKEEMIDIDHNLDKHIHKQMGCMAGLFQIFDRNHFLSGKRIYNNTKRLPPPSPEKSEKDDGKPVFSSPSPVKEIKSETKQVLPVLELKEGTRSSWKFSREAPRLSLDSRAVVDAKGGLHPREIRTNATANLENDGDKQRRSTSSVIVRLMGLDSLPSDSGAKLQRSASESRVSRDRFSEPKLKSNGYTQRSNVGSGQMNNNNHHRSNAVNVNNNVNVVNSYGNIDNGLWNGRGVEGGRGKQNKGTMMVQKKSFYDSTDFFPEPKHNDLIYGEIEKRLKMRGINQPSQDLDTLKHILEALQLKGLLHSQKHDQSPIVLMKPLRSSSLSRFERFNRTGYDSPPPHSSVRSSPRARRNLSPRFDDRAQVNSRNSSPTRRNVPNVETRRRLSNEGVDSRRVSPVNSPKISSRRNATAQTATGGSPRMRKVIDPKVKMLGVAEDEWSTVSENSFTTSNSLTDTEKYKLEEYKEGRNLLDRCDKLLNSIAEITAANELQPSPVSVLDSSFYKDEWCSPSPITKRCIDYNFKDQSTESEDDMWSAGEGKSEEEAKSEDCDFVYVSEILRASSYLPEECDIFLLLEKQQFRKGKDTSKAPTLQRRLIFDTLQEILNRNQRLPPWKAVSKGEETHHIWSEFRRIREREESESEDLFGVICGVLKKDMAEEMSGWGEWTVEMGDVVLDIERLVFKDLIGETIQDLASFAPQCNKQEALRRKLVF
ncbi:putative protein LONGIFOLIA 1/2 [Medicago truncatula]|uniref:DUF4378 domain protein n=1 Tax=Medicago truncatula TaxID=3880 RepID=G7ICP6_MEDTR|nr:protein LONGIFOLIA 2 [Medicago truncatula]AES60804.1 DUF4378 domain protein [Medicago truncatula]RHN80131.1 putative protein LONGIFOLIA 1/2 [Medicago truncatula]